MTVSKTTPVTLLALLALSACHIGLGEDTEWGTQGATSTSTTGTSTTTDTGTTSTTSGSSNGTTTTTSTTSDTATTTGDATADTGTTDPDPVCGNGQMDRGEECDDGSNNGKYNFCNDKCTGPGPRCGDKEIQEDEGCDDGNMANEDACLNTCKTPSCGDGFVQEDVEECDKTENLNFPPGCVADSCMWDKRIVFVTNNKFTPVDDFNDIATADMKCQAAAAEGKLPGTFRAWLSGGTNSPAKDWADDLNNFAGKFVLPNDTIVATGWNKGNLSIMSAINHTETLELAENAAVWTGTTPSGEAGPANCNLWMTSGSVGQTGNTSQSDMKWTANNSSFECTNSARLYCFQTALPKP